MNSKNIIKHFLLQTIVFVIAVVIFSNCAEGPDRDLIERRLFVTHPSLDLIEGDEVQIIASPTNHTFSWSSSNEAIATVSPTGLVTAIADGIAVITVRSSNGLSREITVNVLRYVALNGIEAFNSTTLANLTQAITMTAGQSINMEFAPVPRNFNEDVDFNVIFVGASVPGIIQYDGEDNVLTALNVGNTNLTFRVVDKTAVTLVIPVTVTN